MVPIAQLLVIISQAQVTAIFKAFEEDKPYPGTLDLSSDATQSSVTSCFQNVFL
jgi:hypothetical protein